MYQPKPLKKGDHIALIGLSSHVSPEKIEPMVKAVEALGFVPKVYESCTSRHYIYSGTDERRAKDFEDAFCDDSIDGIFCMRGGYGAARALHLVDWEKVKAAVARKPKYFSGYSDVTAAHICLNEICKLVTWHTPMPTTEWIEEMDDYTRQYLYASMGENPICTIQNPADIPLESWVEGVAEGQLIGGNLSLLAAAVGTEFDFDTRGKILFIEDVGEMPYRIDGMLVQLRNAGKLKDAAGFIIGAFTKCSEDDPDAELPLRAVLEDIFLPLGKPTVMNLRCGHCMPTASLPLGARVRIDHGTVTVLK